MGGRQRALEVVGDGLAGGVLDVVHRQDHDMVAHAHPAIFATVGFDGHVGIFGHRFSSLPALGFAVVGVDMGPLGDVSDELADVLAVFDGRVALLEILQRDLVADGHVLLGL